MTNKRGKPAGSLNRYRIRRMGTRNGAWLYGADCFLCPPTPGGPGKVLAVSGLTRINAALLISEHMHDVHGIEVTPRVSR